MRLVLLGPPGAGKGTQAERLAGTYSLAHISTGEMLRSAVQAQTPMGKEAVTYMNKGDLVPDTVVIGVVAERLEQSDCQQGFILDGFPRTIPQAEALSSLFEEKGIPLDHVVNISVREGEIVKRLTGRRVCAECDQIFHVLFNPPDVVGKCTHCDGKLIQRADDSEEAVRQRLRVYTKQTQPLIEYYKVQGLLRQVNGENSMDNVFAAINCAINVGGSSI